MENSCQSSKEAGAFKLLRDGALTGKGTRGRTEIIQVSPLVFTPHITMTIAELGKMQQRGRGRLWS